MIRKCLLLAILVVLLATVPVGAAKPTKVDENGVEILWESTGCTKIQSGEILSSTSDPLTVGYDQFGYNYQAHIFNGRYCDYDRVLDGAYCDVTLMMKWNDAWLANVDCDGDGLLDRHYGHASYIGSGAWLTNHMWGSYTEGETVCEWDYFTKIVAAPADATLTDGIWHSADGTMIGPAIWGAFATIQTVENDPCAGIEGVQYISPDHAGLGGW